MSYEDFTDFTEVDEGSDITINSSTKISVDTMLNPMESYVYKDYGANHFGDIEHLFDSNFIDAYADFGNATAGIIWALVDTPSTVLDMTDNDVGLTAILYRSKSFPYPFMAYLRDYTSMNTDTIDWGENTPGQRYYTIKRQGTALTLKIYTDSDRTNLEDGLEIVCTNDTYQYLEAIGSRNRDDQPDGWITYNVENLDINEDPCSITTGAASNIAQTTATLNGTLDDMGDETSVDVTFEYGLTTGYGDETTGSTETDPGAIAEGISGLSANTTYHFRIKAVGSYGTVYGDDAQFTTLAAPAEEVIKISFVPHKIGLPNPVNIGF